MGARHERRWYRRTLFHSNTKCNNRIFMAAFCSVCGTFIVWRLTPAGTALGLVWGLGPCQTFATVHWTWPAQHAPAISKRDSCGTHWPQKLNRPSSHFSHPATGNQPPKRRKKYKIKKKSSIYKTCVSLFMRRSLLISPHLHWAAACLVCFSTSDLWLGRDCQLIVSQL